MAKPMEVAGLVIGIPGLLSVCYALGTDLNDRIQVYHQADDIAKDFGTKFNILWKNCNDVLKSFGDVKDTLSVEMADEAEMLLKRLRDILVDAVSKASKYHVPKQWTFGGRIAFAAFRKNELEQVLVRCREWHDDVLKRLLVIKLTHPIMLQATVPSLQGIATLPRPQNHFATAQPQSSAHRVLLQGTPPADLQRLPHSSVFRSISRPNVLFEYRYYDQHAMSTSLDDHSNNIYEVVEMLKSADSQLMNILKCSGVYRTVAQSELNTLAQFALQYSFPPDSHHPRSLRDLLLQARTPSHALNDRFRLANRLAASVLYVHSGQFVHKNIKPENILIMTSRDSGEFPDILGSPFLVGFDRCRHTSTISGKLSDPNLENCIYQYPTRWGTLAEEAYSVIHDIYSLGVVLLEIGLWESLVEVQENGGQMRYVFHQCFQEMVQDGKLKNGFVKTDVKGQLIRVAKQFLPPRVGEAYTKVVIACLTVAEGGIVNMKDFEKPNGEALTTAYNKCIVSEEALTTAYIKYVVTRLEGLKV